MNRRVVVNLILSLALAGFFLFLAFRNVPLTELQAAFAHFDALYLVPAALISITLMLFRAWRWQLELRPLELLPLSRLWVITAVAYMAINLLPARLGEAVRPWLLSRRTSVRISNVVGNLVVEKLMDSFCIVFYILLGLLTAVDLPAWVRHGAIFPAIGAAVFACLVALVWFKGESFIDGPMQRRLPGRIADPIARVLRAILDGMRILPDGRLLLFVFGLSLAMWFLPILSSWVMIRAFDFPVPFNAALIVFIFIGFGTALPNAPGMIGAFQYACILALGLFGVSRPDALAYGLVLNALQVLTIVLQGVIALPFAGVGIGDFRRARTEVAEL